MWIKEPGKVVDGLYFIGELENSIYLLRGRESMIIGGGMSWIVPSIEKQFAAIDFDIDTLKYLVILHSHFDHCGAVPSLKRMYPHMQILASVHSAKVLSKEKVVNYIAAIDRDMTIKMGLESEYERLNLKFDGIQVDRTIAENDVINLGDGMEAHIIDAPGHTECSIVVYVPKLKALFTADSLPTPIDAEDHLFYPSPQYDFGLYKDSVDKMSRYEIDVCAFEHHGAIIGNEAKNVIPETKRLIEEVEKIIIESYTKTGDMDEIAHRLTDERLAANLIDFGSREVWFNVAKAEIRSVLRYAGLIE